MKLKTLAAALLALTAMSAQASVIDYNLNFQDTNGDSFAGQAAYDTSLDLFTAATGTFTYADGATSSSVFPFDINGLPQLFLFDGGTGVAGIFFGPPAVWVDGVHATSSPGFLAIVLDSSPSQPNPTLDPRDYMVDDHNTRYLVSSGSITAVPEPASLALLAAGLIGAGVSRRKSAR